MNQEKNQYEEKIEARISKMEARLDEIRAKANQAKADAKLEYLNQVEKLEEKRAELRKRFQELKNSSEDAWMKLKAGVEDALKTFEKAID